MPYKPLPESWIDTFASQQRLDELRSRVPLDITRSNTPNGMREFDWDEVGVRDFRFPVQDDRTLALRTHGDDDSYPLLLLHGTPSGLGQPVPPVGELNPFGFRVIEYARPGYNDSDRKEGRTVADVAEDVDAITRALGLERFSLIG